MEPKEIRLDEKIKIRSIAPWPTGAVRKTTTGDINVPANGVVYLTREEVIAQGQSGNKLLTGTDGCGSHATWVVEDEYVKNQLDFEVDGRKQQVVDNDTIKKIFELKTMKAFEDNIKKAIVTRAEKVFLIEMIKTLNINDYQKIQFCLSYTGNKL